MTLDTCVRSTLPDAVLWDLDGTIVDTEPVWLEAEFALARRYGGVWTEEDALDLIGSDLLEAAHTIRERMGIEPAPEEIVAAMVGAVADHIRHAELVWRPGAVEMITRLAQAGVPQALVTMSYAEIADALIARMASNPFDAVVTGDRVTHGKPHPEPYLTAAEALGVAPERCVAIEDSGTGTRSAAAAGCQVLVIPNLVPVEPGERRTFAASLADLGPDDLGALVTGTAPAR